VGPKSIPIYLVHTKDPVRVEFDGVGGHDSKHGQKFDLGPIRREATVTSWAARDFGDPQVQLSIFLLTVAASPGAPTRYPEPVRSRTRLR